MLVGPMFLDIELFFSQRCDRLHVSRGCVEHVGL